MKRISTTLALFGLALFSACGEDSGDPPPSTQPPGHEHHHHPDGGHAPPPSPSADDPDAGAAGHQHPAEPDGHNHHQGEPPDAGAHDAEDHGDHHGSDEVNGHAHHDPRPSTPLIPDGGDLNAAITFSNLHARVLVPSCTASSCHGRGFSAYLNLTDKDGAHASLVDQEALGEPCFGQGQVRVVPGAPEQSLLLKKLEGTACGARMPKDATHLPPEQVELIRAWIYAGAKND